MFCPKLLGWFANDIRVVHLCNSIHVVLRPNLAYEGVCLCYERKDLRDRHMDDSGCWWCLWEPSHYVASPHFQIVEGVEPAEVNGRS